jgi:hypothetical protein
MLSFEDAYYQLLIALKEEDLCVFIEDSEGIGLEGRENLLEFPVDKSVSDSKGFGEDDAQSHEGVAVVMTEVRCSEFQRDSTPDIDFEATKEETCENDGANIMEGSEDFHAGAPYRDYESAPGECFCPKFMEVNTVDHTTGGMGIEDPKEQSNTKAYPVAP